MCVYVCVLFSLLCIQVRVSCIYYPGVDQVSQKQHRCMHQIWKPRFQKNILFGDLKTHRHSWNKYCKQDIWIEILFSTLLWISSQIGYLESFPITLHTCYFPIGRQQIGQTVLFPACNLPQKGVRWGNGIIAFFVLLNTEKREQQRNRQHG